MLCGRGGRTRTAPNFDAQAARSSNAPAARRRKCVGVPERVQPEARESDRPLSPAERRALPWSRELRDIEGRLDVLFERREALLQRLPTDGAKSLPELAERLAVVERLVVLDEHPEANGILNGVRRDLLALSDPGPAPPAQGRAPAA